MSKRISGAAVDPYSAVLNAVSAHDLRLFSQLDTPDVHHQLFDLGKQIDINSAECEVVHAYATTQIENVSLTKGLRKRVMRSR